MALITQPFSAIGDIHGCLDELYELLDIISKRLPKDATIYSLGDVVDKHPVAKNSNDCLELLAARNVKLIIGNHDYKYIEYIRKKRDASTIKDEKKREIYSALSTASKEYLLSGVPFKRIDDKFLLVHAGVGPHHDLSGLIDGKTFNEIIRIRYVNRNTLDKVSTIHNEDGTWAPAIPVEQTFKWPEVYDRRYGCVIYGHMVEDLDCAYLWPSDNYTNETNHQLVKSVGVDTGCVFGGHLTAAIFDKDILSFERVKAKAKYTS